MGVVPRNPESVTSSTVSPMERTRVALVNETTMYASYSSGGERGRREMEKEGEGEEKDNNISILVSSLIRRRHYHLHLLIADLQEEQNGGHTLRVSTH